LIKFDELPSKPPPPVPSIPPPLPPNPMKQNQHQKLPPPPPPLPVVAKNPDQVILIISEKLDILIFYIHIACNCK
jgi:hypothetical protein